MIRLIGFNGGMGVGKSTAVDEVVRYARLNGSDARLIKFAGVLYDIQAFMYQQIAPVYRRPADFTKDRKLLQWIGTEWGRDTISKTLWVDLWKAATVHAIDNKWLVVCDDVRFDNEADIIHELGGKVIKITSERTAERIDVNAGIANHKSEAGIDPTKVDAHLRNDSTLAEFQQAIRQTLAQLSADHQGRVA